MGFKLQISMDFVLTIMVFITLVTYFLFYLLSERNVSVVNLNRDKKLTKAIAISQILVNDYGEPKNWETYLLNPSAIKRPGLLIEGYQYPNYITKTKTWAFMYMFCVDKTKYDNLKKLLDLDDYNVIIVTKFSDGTTYVCPNPSLNITLGSPENITRKAFDSENNQTVTIFVAVGDGR